MPAPTRTLREQLLTTLPEQERNAIAPLSDATIKKAVAQGERDREAVSGGEQLPPFAPSLRFQ